MNFHKALVALFPLLTISHTQNTTPSNNSITLFSGSGLTGTSKSYNLSSCVSLEGDSLDLKVLSVNTFGSCVKLYGDYNCSGDKNIAIKTDRNFNHQIYFDGFHVSSFGSCQPSNCTDTKQIETRRTSASFMYTNPGLPKHLQLEFFSSAFVLSFGGCWNIDYVRTAGHNNTPFEFFQLTHSTCVKLFMSPGCKGESKTFEAFNPSSDVDDDLLYGAPIEISPHKWQFSKSMSLCGINCIGSENFSSSFIKKSTVPDGLCTRARSTAVEAGPTEEKSGGADRPLLLSKKGNPEVEPSGHTVLWIAIMIFAFVGIAGMAEGFRRYRVYRSQQTVRVRQFLTVPEELL